MLGMILGKDFVVILGRINFLFNLVFPCVFHQFCHIYLFQARCLQQEVEKVSFFCGCFAGASTADKVSAGGHETLEDLVLDALDKPTNKSRNE